MTEPATRRTRTPSRDVHAALVEAAEVVLVRDGPAAVTVRAVATEAGVAPMGVYNRFGSKDGLIELLLIRGFRGLRDAVAGPEVAASKDQLELLRASGVRYREFALSHRQHYAIMFEGVIPVMEFSQELGEAASAAFGALVTHVGAAMASGAIAAGDPLEVAQVVWSCVHGAVTLELQGNCQVPDPAANYVRLIDVLIRGLLP